MNLLFPKLAVLLAGMVTLMAGILLSREPGQSVADAVVDSMVWGGGLFVSFGVEFWLLAGA